MIIKILRFILATVLFLFAFLIFIFTILPSFITKSYEQKQIARTTGEYAGCNVSNKLRIKIGETIFELPRRNVSGTKGPDVQWEGEPIYSQRLDGDDICQKENDPPLIYDQIQYNFIPKKCPRIAMHEGRCTRLSGWLFAIGEPDMSQEERREKSIEECKTDSYFNTCKHSIMYEDTGFYFQYYLQSYPLEDIENTERMVIEYFKARDITETVKGSEKQTSTIEKADP